MRSMSAGKESSSGAAGGAAGTPCRQLCGAGALPLAEFTAVEQVELGADAQYSGSTACRCANPQGGGATSRSEQRHPSLFWSYPLNRSKSPCLTCTGKLLLRLLLSGVAIAALLVLAFGVVPQSKRWAPGVCVCLCLKLRVCILRSAHLKGDVTTLCWVQP